MYSRVNGYLLFYFFLSLSVSLSLSLSVSISFSLSLSIYLSYSLYLSLSLPLSLSLSLPLSPPVSLYLSHPLSRYPLSLSPLSISLALSRCLSLSRSPPLSRYPPLSLSPPPSLSLSLSLSRYPPLSLYRYPLLSLSLSLSFSLPLSLSLYLSLSPPSLSPSLAACSHLEASCLLKGQWERRGSGCETGFNSRRHCKEAQAKEPPVDPARPPEQPRPPIGIAAHHHGDTSPPVDPARPPEQPRPPIGIAAHHHGDTSPPVDPARPPEQPRPPIGIAAHHHGDTSPPSTPHVLPSSHVHLSASPLITTAIRAPRRPRTSSRAATSTYRHRRSSPRRYEPPVDPARPPEQPRPPIGIAAHHHGDTSPPSTPHVLPSSHVHPSASPLITTAIRAPPSPLKAPPRSARSTRRPASSARSNVPERASLTANIKRAGNENILSEKRGKLGSS